MLTFVLLGFTVGFLVGLTGIGGGALMTPSLIFLGVEPLTAVGTDLLYATITRIFGIVFRYRKGRIRTDIALKLLAGSVPAILIGGFLIRYFTQVINEYLTIFLGVVLVSSSILGLIKEIKLPVKPKVIYVYLLGFIVGFIVQFTSIGAGVIVSFALLNVARVDPRDVIGITLLYGLGLSLISSTSYLILGKVNYNILLLLTIGSIPGVYTGTLLSSTTDKEKLKKIMNVLILVIGILILLRRFFQ
ncbi:sulfite exporter TauE/SafE family protein [Pyrococcus abyssi]|uniref:Probable membrane transporter protein n=1 Tax=Pyrococcus abyssi (strain GE5 / Orsay) TaxID=272844 RepID=Q9UZH5_PYRAB|nr:sulfite exporter TauE/SafE family protein [Pyrococcus abyssi]CAB50084.1 Predicted permease [Pyrococcus abyssi GE5]CCE70598.1 TPA: hypothetical protein PAB0782 [Pyrococcus abyssi GE5]